MKVLIYYTNIRLYKYEVKVNFIKVGTSTYIYLTERENSSFASAHARDVKFADVCYGIIFVINGWQWQVQANHFVGIRVFEFVWENKYFFRTDE